MQLPKTRGQLFAELARPAGLTYRKDPVRWAIERAQIETWSKQREILEAVRDHPKVAIRACHSAGKGLWVETPLPTPTGWVRMGDVQVGDLLYDEAGRPTRVTGVSEVRQLDCYRVTFTDNSSLVADGDHLWSGISMSARRKVRGKGHVDDWRDHWDVADTLNTRELFRRTVSQTGSNKTGIPAARCLETGADVDLLIPPYVLGAWLGDGCSWNAQLANHPDDGQIVEEVEALGWVTKRSIKRPIEVRLRPSADQPMTPLLRAYDLVKNKHIPAVYLRASRAQRLELLRGLMDTDGTVSQIKKGGTDARCDVGFKHEVLARQTYELIRSLGWRATFSTRRALLNGKDCGPFYVVYFTADEVPFRLARKANAWKPGNARVTLNSVKSVEPVPTVPTRCITVDSSRSLYLAGEGMNVTHNSYTMGLMACWWLDSHPVGEARVISTAPTSKQVDGVLWNEINQHHDRIGLAGRTNRREWYIGKFLAGMGRKPPDHVQAAFQGLHARYLLVMFDEAYGIPRHLWDEGSSLASNINSRMVAVGNPDGPGHFEEVCRPDSGWHVIHIPYDCTPNFTDEEVSDLLREMLVSREWVEDRRRVWGEDSALFQAKCLGNFPQQGSPWQVVPPAWATACRYLESVAEGRVEAGVDVGGGNDRTVVTIRQGPAILHVESFVDADPMRTVGAVARTLSDWKAVSAKVDSIGIGWGIYGRLRELSSKVHPYTKGTVHDADIIPINVGQSPTPGQEEIFYNRRAEMWWLGRENSRLQHWDFSRLPADVQDTLIHELTMPNYQIVDSKGKVKIEPKEKVIERLGQSPDVAESVLLAFVPDSWTAETVHVGGLLQAPSLLGAFSAMDSLNRRGW